LWRKMKLYDVGTAAALANEHWSQDYFEGYDTFLNKYITSSETCYMYFDSGYVFSHPWNSELLPEINKSLPECEINCLHIHDILLIPTIRERGIGKEIITKLLRENERITLIAVAGTYGYWRKFGFDFTGKETDYGRQMILSSDRSR